MRKLILFLVFILSIISFTNVKGAGVAIPFDDYYPNSPRFQYWTDDSDALIPLSMTFIQQDDTFDETYKIDIEQMDLNGNVVNLLKTYHIDPEDPLADGFYWETIIYDWSNPSVLTTIVQNKPMFYRVVYNGTVVLYTGGLMLRPEFVDYESARVEFGDYVYNSSGLVDSDDQTQFTYNLTNDNLITIHYRFDTDIIPMGDGHFIKFMDLSTMTNEFTITSDIILSMQGGSDIDHRNSFIPVFISDSYPAFMETDIDIYNSRNYAFYHNFGVGSYLVYIIDDTSTYITDSEATALLNVANSDSAFDLILSYDSLKLNQKQKVTYLKDNEESDSVYTTTIARDQALLVDWSSEVDSVMVQAIGYSLLQTLEIGDIVSVVWQLEPTSLPFSISTSSYVFADIESYVVTGATSIDTSLTTTIDWFGWNNSTGLIFVSVGILVVANMIMSALRLDLMIALVVNGAILGLLSFIGFLPIWLLIGEMLILALGMLLKFGRGGSD